MSKELITALSNQNHDLATMILESGQFNLLSTDSLGQSAVHLASQNGYIKMLTWLSKIGFNLNARARDGGTALHQVVRLRELHAVKHLVSLGANVNSLTALQQTPLHLAVTRDDKTSLEISRILINAGSHLNKVGTDGTALHIAARKGNLLQLKTLLKAGADAQIFDQKGALPLTIAKKNNFERICHLLADHYDDNLASDTDSEDEQDYNYTLPYDLQDEIENSLDIIDDQLKAMSLQEQKEDKLSTPSSSSVSSQNAIAHYRGVHFYKEYFNRTQRRDAIKLHHAQSQDKVIALGLHSSATHELAKQPILYPPIQNEDDYDALNETLAAREKKLTQQDVIVSKRVSAWQTTGPVAPCLGGSKASRDSYSSRYIEYIQRYVNSYKTLMEDMAVAPNKKLDGRSSERVKQKFQAFKSLQFTKLPFVSTSEEPHWGLEYATAILNWDKATHLPRTGNVTVLTPCYQRDGHPRFPYLGILHVILHSKEDLSNGLSTRILDLFTKNEIDTKCSSPGGHVKGGYMKARERVFIGGIDAHHVKLSIIVRVPNFSHPYREFIKDKYGIDEVSYNMFKSKLHKYGRLRNDGSGKMANSNEFMRTEQEIIQYVIQQQEAVVEKRAATIAQKLQLTLSYFGVNSDAVEAQSLELKAFVDQHGKQVKNLGKR